MMTLVIKVMIEKSAGNWQNMDHQYRTHKKVNMPLCNMAINTLHNLTSHKCTRSANQSKMAIGLGIHRDGPS